MASKLKTMNLSSIDDLFKTDEERLDETRERVQIVPADEVFPYVREPYSVDRPTPDLAQLMDSIERIGILEPLIVRNREEGGYEIIAGHRRDYCARMIGLQERPVIVRECTDEEADILVVDYNIHREDLLPSEKAKAYKLRLDAMRRKVGRPGKNSLHNGEEFRGKTSVKILSEQADESVTNIQRFIRLTGLVPELLDQVDAGKFKLVPAADYISKLTEKEQQWVAAVMDRDEVSPSVGQAKALKEASSAGNLTAATIKEILMDDKPCERKVTLRNDKLKQFFPPEYTPRQMEAIIMGLLETWQRSRAQDNKRS